MPRSQGPISVPGQRWEVWSGRWFENPSSLAYCKSSLTGLPSPGPSAPQTRPRPSARWGPTLDSISSVCAFTCCSRFRSFRVRVATSSESWYTGTANQTRSSNLA